VKRPPTDFELLKAIYAEHHAEYVGTDPPRVEVAIDVPAIARELGVEPNSVVGRLYHHLDRLYGETKEQAAGRPRKFLFTMVAGQKVNCVNFPMLEAVLAGLWQQRDRDTRTFWTAIGSIVIAGASLAVSILAFGDWF